MGALALDPNRVVFVDEMTADAQMDRRYPPRGQSAVGAVPHGHDESHTFTAAQVLDGPMTGPRFRHDLAAVLVPTLRPGTRWCWTTRRATRRRLCGR